MTFDNRQHLNEASMRREWDSSAELRAEFGNNFARYSAFAEADARGLVKIFSQPRIGGRHAQ